MRAIARELHCSRDTIKKTIASTAGEPYALTKERPDPDAGPYTARIDKLLADSERRLRKQRYTGHKICKLIRNGASNRAVASGLPQRDSTAHGLHSV